MANPVPSDKLVDLQSNAQTTDSFVNSGVTTVTARPTPSDPTGKVIKTLAGITADVELALQRIGVQYSDPIADWTALTEITAFEAHRYPATTGDLYIPTAPLPFTTGATFDTDNWTLLQGLTLPAIIGDTSIPYIFDTVALYKASTITFPVGKTIRLNDRGADFTVISGTGTANDFGIIASDQVSQSIEIVETLPKSTLTESEAVAELNVYTGRRFILSDRGFAEFELQTGQTADTFGIIDVDAPSLSLVYIPKNNTYYTSAFGVKTSTIGGTDYTDAFQASIDALPNGGTLVNDVDTTIAGSTEVNITSKTKCKFAGKGLIQLKNANTVSNSKAMINADLCVDCDFSFNFDGNNQNASNDVNGTQGLIGCLYLTNSKRCDVFDCHIANCNNVGIYFTTNCVDCHGYNNHTVDCFGTDYKIANSARDCSFHDNSCVVTRNIHAEDYSGTGEAGKQDGFLGARFGAVNAKFYNNQCDNTNGTGVNQGVCAFAGWYKGMVGTFESYNNRFIGANDSIQCYLDDGVDVNYLRLEDTCIGAADGDGGVTVGTVGADVAHVDDLVVKCTLNAYSTGISLESNGGNFTVDKATVVLKGKVSAAGNNALLSTVDNTHISGSIEHLGSSHAISLDGVTNCSVKCDEIKTGAQVARTINLQDVTATVVTGNRIIDNNNISIRELGTSDNNIITNNIVNTTISVIGASTISANNLESVA